MDKSMKIGLILIGWGLLLGGITRVFSGDNQMRIEAEYEVNTYQYENKFDNIIVEVENETVEVKPSPDQKIHIIAMENEDNKLVVNEGANLEISMNSKNNIVFGPLSIGTIHRKIEVLVPDELMSDISVTTKNGDINANEVSLKGLETKTTNGDIELSAITASQNAVVKNTNGRIKLNNLNVNGDLQANTVNGGIGIDNLEVNNVRVGTTSGDIDLVTMIVKNAIECETTNGDIDISASTVQETTMLKSTNGDIDARDLEVNSDVDATSTNGDITIGLASTIDNYAIMLESKVGNKQINHNQQTSLGEGKTQIDVSTNTGNVSVTTK
ncbi:DUF4097 family beta strand repeat-containing protein [Mollicutes bacterium LVI A0039]|nr:DUF4097 family beta strand repeat-containing protein [Mollicutes bacterium LVI A0039]